MEDNKGKRIYAFDEFNNRISKSENGKETITYKYNNLNQLEKIEQGKNEVIYSYDKRGNLKKTEENGKLQKEYVFDSTNKLAKVTGYNNG